MKPSKTTRRVVKTATPAPRQKRAPIATPAPPKLSALPAAEPENETLPVDKRLWWYALCAASVIVFMASALLAHKHVLTGWEASLFTRINDWPNSLRPYFLAATIMPESLWIGVVAVAATFLLKMYRLTWQLALAVMGGSFFVLVAKKLIGRARPAEFLSSVHLRAYDTGNGFPSGHTMMMTVIVLTLWPHLPRGWRWLTLLLIPLVGLSRIYLGLHAPLDIIGGVAAGALVVSCMRSMPDSIRKLFRLD